MQSQFIYPYTCSPTQIWDTLYAVHLTHIQTSVLEFLNKGGNSEQLEKALLGFEPRISCLLDRRFNQLSHSAGWGPPLADHEIKCPKLWLCLTKTNKVTA